MYLVNILEVQYFRVRLHITPVKLVTYYLFDIRGAKHSVAQ